MHSLTFLATTFLLARQPTIEDPLLTSARQSLDRNDTDGAFESLLQLHSQNADTPGLMSCFEDMFRIKIEQHGKTEDRMGLASLLSDRGRYQEAAQELEEVVNDKKGAMATPLQDKAISMLFGCRAAICDWDNMDPDSLVKSVRESLRANRVPSLHPYEALMWPCISLEDATRIAGEYAKRSMTDAGCLSTSPFKNKDKKGSIPFIQVPNTEEEKKGSIPFIQIPNTVVDQPRRIKIGYISPDFTGVHPLAFLLQDMFRFHNTSQFDVHIYSLCKFDASPEVEKIRNAADKWTVLSSNLTDIENTIVADKLDVLIDLCGYTGTSLVVQAMARRLAPIQIGYMGFPASTGASFIDYIICDQIVIGTTNFAFRKHYSEKLIVMPHCYFANSHRYIFIKDLTDDGKEMALSRASYNLPEKGFIYCCHSRPEKIDPHTFRLWLKVIKKVRDNGVKHDVDEQSNAVLWLLRSGDEMETRLRTIAKSEFGLGPETLIFTGKAARQEHLSRLQHADLFLDTPAYNAHTVGCDCLVVGVPMVSLLLQSGSQNNGVATEKLASRVGASLLQAVGLEELIAACSKDYESIMIRCASDHQWYSTIRAHLKTARDKSPLFDMERWVKNLEAGLIHVAQHSEEWKDVHIIDDA